MHSVWIGSYEKSMNGVNLLARQVIKVKTSWRRRLSPIMLETYLNKCLTEVSEFS